MSKLARVLPIFLLALVGAAFAITLSAFDAAPVLASGLADVITNTVTITVPGGVTDPSPGDNSATDTSILSRRADLSIRKSVTTSGVAGTPITYTLVVTNAGPSAATGASITDTLPANVVGATWTCAASTGSLCGLASGSGSVYLTVTLLVSGRVTVTVRGSIDSATPSGSLSNTASVAPPGDTDDPIPVDNTTPPVTTTITLESRLSLTKAFFGGVPVPGTVITYRVVVTNAGPSVAAGAALVDLLPAALTGATWTCSASGGSSCGAASGSGSLNTTATLLVNGVATYLIRATISPAVTGALTNNASVTPPTGTTDPTPGDNTDTSTVTLTPQANLSVTKTRIGGSPIPGTVITYQVVVNNSGPSNASGAVVVDNLPASLTGATWTCSASAGSSCGAASGSGNLNVTANLLVGGSATYVIRATINPAATGALANSASVAPPTGVTDPTPGDNTDTDTVTLTPQTNVAILKTSAGVTAIPGTPFTYTLVVSNAGPSFANNAPITDGVPAALTNVTWSCAASSGSLCNTASGAGNNVLLTADLLVSGRVTVTIRGLLDSAVTGMVANVGLVGPGSGATDPTPIDNSDSPTPTTLTPQADIWAAKTDNQVYAVPGLPITYAITVGNHGPSTAPNVTVFDAVAPVILNPTWTCVGNTGATCGLASGTGNISLTVTLPPSGTVTITLSGVLSSTATGTFTTGNGPRQPARGLARPAERFEVKRGGAHGAKKGLWSILPVHLNAPVVSAKWQVVSNTLTNTVTLALPPGVIDNNPADNASDDISLISNQADLGVGAAARPGTFSAPTTFDYLITVHNYGPSISLRATLTATFPAAVGVAQYADGKTLRASSGCAVPVCLISLGLISPGESAVVTLSVTILPQASNPFSARFFVLGETLPDPYLENNSASVGSVVIRPPTAIPLPTATPSPAPTPAPEIGPTLFKSVAPAFASPGSIVTYTIRVRSGGIARVNILIEDAWPGALMAYRGGWITQGALTYDAAGKVLASIPLLPANAEVLITLSGQVNPAVSPPAQIANVAVMRVDGRAGPSAQATLYVVPGSFPVTGVGWVASGGGLGLLGILTLAGRRVRWLAVDLLLAGALTACGLFAPPAETPSPPPAAVTHTPTVVTLTLPSPAAETPTVTPFALTPATQSGQQIVTPDDSPVPALTATPFLARAFAQAESVARLAIPALGLDQSIVTVPLVNGMWDSSVLGNHIGWLQSTGDQPGAGLAMALAGHITIAKDVPGPFLNLAVVPLGTEVIYSAPNGVYRYRVESAVIVAPDQTAALYLADGARLILTTCINWDRKARAYRDRLVVTAVLEKSEP